MDGDSDFPPKVKKCASGVDGGVDRISRLPDEILLVIVSFLRLREAAATSVLSSRWTDLWKHTPNLDFDPYDVDADHQIWDAKGFEVVNSVIQSHKAISLKKFRIGFDVEKSAKSTLTKWLEFVFSRQVESLELNFSFVHYSNMVVLEELLREMSIIFGAPQTLFFCQSLKSLSLVGMKVGGQDVELFLHNCPLLEELILDAAVTSDINVCGAKLMLKYLCIYGYGVSNSVRVFAPNLSSFTFSDAVGKLVLEYVPELVEADLISVSSEFVVQHIAVISQLQVLELSFTHSKKLLTGMFPHMPNLKKLSICFDSIINRSLLRLTELIWASPRLEEFTLRSIVVVTDLSALMEDITNVERSPHQHLKVVEFDMYSNLSDHLVELATYISENCVALREIVIHHRVQDERVQDYLKQQLQGKAIARAAEGITVEVEANRNLIWTSDMKSDEMQNIRQRN